MNVNLTFFNSSISSFRRLFSNDSIIDEKYKNILDIYVVPNDQWNQFTNGFEMKQINFTWQATNLTERELTLKLDFNNASYLSPEVIRD
jgi:hypothetical protein